MRQTAEQILTEALAVAEGGLTQTALVTLLGDAGIRVDGRKPRGRYVRALTQATPGVVRDGRYMLHEPEPMFGELWRSGRLFDVYDTVEAVEPFAVSRGYLDCGRHVVLRTLRRALLEADDERLRIVVGHATSEHYDRLRAWFIEPMRPSMLDALSDLGAWVVFHRAIDMAPHCFQSLVELRAYFESRPNDTPGRRYAAARLELLRGRLDEARALLTSLPSGGAPLTRGMLALLDGDAKLASKHYAAHLSQQRGRLGNGYVPHEPEALYLPVAYLLHGTKARLKQAQKLVDRAGGLGWTEAGRMHSGWIHIAELMDATAPVYASDHQLGFVLEALTACWRGEEPDPKRVSWAISTLNELGLEVFADALAAGAEGPVARLRAVRPAWKEALAALAVAVGDDSASAEAPKKKERLAWRLGVYRNSSPYLEAKLQKAAKGGWSKGRKVSLSRLQGRPDTTLPLTEADRRLVSALRRRIYRNYRGYSEEEISWDPIETWRSLVDHPAVFDLQGVHLRIVRRSPALKVVERERGLSVEIEPCLAPDTVEVERVGNAYEVTLLDGEQRAVAEVVGSGLFFPREAGPAVRELLGRARNLFRSEAPEAVVRSGSTVVHAFLTPEGTSISVELGVLPAGPDGVRHPPGSGPPIVLAPKSEGSVRVARDLALERAYLNQALRLPGLDASAVDSPTVMGLDETLDFLAAARDREIPVLWPEGGEIRVRRSSAFGLQVRSAREWFETRGSIELDDGETLALIELARRYMSEDRRFVRLDDGSFLELEARIRRGMDALVRLGEPVGDAIRVHSLATSALTSVLELDGVHATRAARSRLEQTLAKPAAVEIPRGLRAELRPYQEEAFRWLCGLAQLGAGAILADDMGLGKTVTSLALLLSRRLDGPAVVIAPTSVGGNWVRESRRFAPQLNVHRLRELDAEAVGRLGAGDLLVCSYALLVHRIDGLARAAWSTVVFDESQALKNPKTQRHQAALRIQAGFRLALTGTPIENHLGELHAQMSVVLPGLLGSARRFSRHFARPIEAGDADARRSLKALVSPFLLRRTKGAVLDDLPPRTELEHYVELTVEETQLYEAYRLEALASLEEDAGAMDVLGRLSRLRQLACSPALVLPSFEGESSKTKAFRRLVRDLDAAGHRALVFSQFVKHLQLLRGVLDDEGLGHVYLDGSTPAARRDALVEEFQAGDVPFFLISLKAGGTGLNLTAADYVLHMDPWWNPAVEDQASDRAHRIGQRRPVTVYRVVARGTVEEQIVALHRQKRDLAEQILEGSEKVERLSADDLLGLLAVARS